MTICWIFIIVFSWPINDDHDTPGFCHLDMWCREIQIHVPPYVMRYQKANNHKISLHCQLKDMVYLLIQRRFNATYPTSRRQTYTNTMVLYCSCPLKLTCFPDWDNKRMLRTERRCVTDLKIIEYHVPKTVVHLRNPKHCIIAISDML